MITEIFANKKAPYICTPLTGKTKAEVLEQLEKVIVQAPDLIEWRADFLIDLADVELVVEIIQEMRVKTAIPILFTIRAEHEGGEKISLTEDEKVHLLSEVCKRTNVDLIDYETSNEKKYVNVIRDMSQKSGKKLILSYHNFGLTPENEELVRRAEEAVEYGADIAKFAVMPQSQEDVLRLLAVTKQLDDLLEVPVITMSMGELGGLSRIVGWVYGSIITFGVGVELSAPGQMPVQKLREAIGLTQELVPSWK